MIIKDLTSILSMAPAVRGPILSALREVYDGHYVRDAGVDGGTKIPWTGRIVVIGAVTTAWDSAHGVIAEMGDRFALLRVDSTDNRLSRTDRAVNNTGSETGMRDELSRLAHGVIAGINPESAPTLTKEERDAIVAAADVVSLARTAVMHDYRGDVIDAHAPELGTRFAKQLAQVFRGAVVIGLDRAEAIRLAIRVARDSMPPLRLKIIDDLAAHPHSTPTEVRRRIGKPRATVDRQLQALHILGVTDLEECESIDDISGKFRTQWYYSLTNDIDPTVLSPSTVTRNITSYGFRFKEGCVDQGEEEECAADTHTPSYISGNGTTSANGHPSTLGDAGFAVALNTATPPTNTEQHDRYNASLCVDCGEKPPSTGRPRCDKCHRIHQNVMSGYDR